MIKQIYICDKCGKEIHGVVNVLCSYKEENGRLTEVLSDNDIHICEDCYDQFMNPEPDPESEEKISEEEKAAEENPEEEKNKKRRKTPGRRAQIDIEKIMKLREQGMTVKEVSAETGYSLNQVNGAIQREKLKQKTYIAQEEADKGKILALAEAGWSSKKIADEMRMCEKDVASILDR